jgi:hypothetical protein
MIRKLRNTIRRIGTCLNTWQLAAYPGVFLVFGNHVGDCGKDRVLILGILHRISLKHLVRAAL